MSDITAVLQEAIANALRADAGVDLAFGASPVKIYRLVPPNAVAPYLVLVPGPILPILAEGMDLSECDWDVQVWSRPNPPSTDEATALAKAVGACMLGVRVAAGGQVLAATPVRTSPPLSDPRDPRLTKTVTTTRFTTAPAAPA